MLASYKLKLLDSLEKDRRVHEVLQRHPRKKSFIVDAILEHDKALAEGRRAQTSKRTKEPLAYDSVMEKLITVDEKVTRLLEQGIPSGPREENPVHEDASEKRWNPVESSLDNGLDATDIENFQLASQAFGAFDDNEDD